MRLELTSQVIITDEFSQTIDQLKKIAPKEIEFELFVKEDSNFLVSDANEVIAKAYLTSENSVVLCLCANSFSDIVQNRLLKIIEEPPKNKIFIIITPSKSALLSTIKSRLPVNTIKHKQIDTDIVIDIENLNLQSVYNFLQENKRLKAQDAIILIENIIKQAVRSNNYKLDEASLELFSKIRLALDIGSPTDFLLTTLLLKLLAKKVKN